MDTTESILARWPSMAAIASDLGIDEHAVVRMWKSRGLIPVEHFPGLVRSAAKRDIPGITLEKLFEVRSRAGTSPDLLQRRESTTP